MISLYYRLAKPGIVYSNALTALAAYLFATQSAADARTALLLVLGLSLAIAGAAALNNVMDRDIDSLMERTRMRALPSGRITVRQALIFGSVCGIVGLGILYAFVSPLSSLLTLLGTAVYLAAYTPLKRTTSMSTLVGAISGGIPPVVGYVAGTNFLDLTSLLLLLILATWQMAHFFSIGMYRADEYRAAHLPIAPAVRSSRRIQLSILLYIAAFTAFVMKLGIVNESSYGYFAVMALICAGWIILSLSGFRARDLIRWSRRMFFFSLIALLAWCLSLAFG